MQSATVTLPSGAAMPRFGLGTWGFGEDASRRGDEIAALRRGLELGAGLIDSAEMYADGEAERVVAAAIGGRRDEAFLVSKAYPHNAAADALVAACERSLRRLRTEVIDLYLLHWRGGVPLAQTLDGFERLRDAGKIRDYGVSNFDLADLAAAAAAGFDAIACNQVLYSLARREPEWAVAPWCRERGAALMAYCPLDQGGALLRHAALRGVAARRGATPAQVALAWLLAQGAVVIPKTARAARVDENAAARSLRLDAAALAELDAALPGPRRPVGIGVV